MDIPKTIAQDEPDQSMLLAYLETEEDSARQYQRDELQPERERNLNYLLGRPMGNEVDGRSQVVSSDVWDAIEGMLPLLLKPFTTTDEYVKFEPTSEEDVPAAEQETEYVNYLIAQKNNGYLLFYQWFWDALVNKYGIVEYGWETEEKTTVERYSGLDDAELAMVTQATGVEVEEYTANQTEGPDGMPVITHDVAIRVTNTEGQARIHNIPPEEFIFNSDLFSQSIKDARFVQREVYKSISDLRDIGYDIPDDIADDGQDYYTEIERANRYDGFRYGEFDQRDGANRLVLLKTAHCRYDLNEDGIAELIKVVRIGDTILELEETEEIPYSAIHCNIIPHKFAGVAIADVVAPIQDLKTSLWRQALDNIYGINSNRVFVSNRVDLDDLLSDPLSGVVRVDADSAHGHVAPAPVQPIVGIIQPMIEYADTVKENRTGYTRYNSGMDANSLNQTATGVNRIMDAAAERMEMISRTFAETGVKDLMLGLHGLVRRSATKPEIARLRNQWVPVDPRNWKTRVDMTVSVGLGTSDRTQQIQQMQMLGQVQQQVIPLGLTDRKKIYNAIRRGAEAMGYKDVDQFFTEPEDGSMPPPKPDIDVIKAANTHTEKMLDIALEAVKLGILPPEMFTQGFMQVVQKDMKNA